MPSGSKRPYTRKQKDDVKLAKKRKGAWSSAESPKGSASATDRRARDTGKRPKKRNALSAAKHRVKKVAKKYSK